MVPDMKSVRPWPAKTDCPLEGFAEFKRALFNASFHNAAESSGEAGDARKAIYVSAEIAIEQEWPYWAMERMFSEIRPLVTWGSFMQNYINILHAKATA
jgi:hypothetical protein